MLDELEATNCLQCGCRLRVGEFEAHDCQRKARVLSTKESQEMRDDFMFLRGLVQGISFFSETTNMGAAMESAEDQLHSISNRVFEALGFNGYLKD